jgi:hypothetical protein
MPMNAMIKVTTVLFLIFSGCASTLDYAGFQERSIDRSPTVEATRAEWKPFFAYSVDSEAQSELYPFRWEHGFSERITLVWMPLPLEIRALILREEDFWLVGEFALLGPVQSRLKDFHWWPSLSFALQKKFNANWAWGVKLFFQPEFKRGASTRKNSSSYEIEFSVLQQASELISIGFCFSALWEQGDIRARYIGRVPDPTNQSIRFPLGARLSYALSRSWELELKAKIYQIGYSSDFSSLPLFLTIAHTW